MTPRLSRVLSLIALVLALAAIASLAPPAADARADGAPAPIGAWRATYPDGSTLDLVLAADGTCSYGPSGWAPTVGVASWKPSSASGGILDIKYYNAGIESHAYYGITWVDRNTIVLSDPYFRVEMHRVGT